MSCELCGAKIEGDSTVCLNRYFGEVLNREYSNSDYGSVHLLTVDCYALQHSESCGLFRVAFVIPYQVSTFVANSSHKRLF